MQARPYLVHRCFAARAAHLRAGYQIARHNRVRQIARRILNDGFMLWRVDSPALARGLQHFRDGKAIVKESIAAADHSLGWLIPLADAVGEAQPRGPVIFVVDVTLRLPTHAVADRQILSSLPIVLVVQTDIGEVNGRARFAVSQVQLAGSAAERLNLLECLAGALAVDCDAIGGGGIGADAARTAAGKLGSAKCKNAVKAGVGGVGVAIHAEAPAKIDGVRLQRDLGKILQLIMQRVIVDRLLAVAAEGLTAGDLNLRRD